MALQKNTRKKSRKTGLPPKFFSNNIPLAVSSDRDYAYKVR
jgi:hypothetical protein